MSNKISIKDITYCSVFTALIIVLSYISIPLPLSPVPITGQSLAIMLTASILNTKQTGLTILTYLLLGIIGLPVFAGGGAGIGSLLGPKGGYLLGFLIGGLIISLLRRNKHKLISLLIANTIGGLIVVYTSGAIWLSLATNIQIRESILIGVLPFIPGGIIKVLIASFIAIPINKRISKL